jgi:hypothetical protein
LTGVVSSARLVDAMPIANAVASAVRTKACFLTMIFLVDARLFFAAFSVR